MLGFMHEHHAASTTTEARRAETVAPAFTTISSP